MATESQPRAHKAGAFDIRLIIALLIGVYGVILTVMGIGFTSDEIKKLVDLDYDYMNRNDVDFKEWWDKELKS